jgi:hypothetical protein
VKHAVAGSGLATEAADLDGDADRDLVVMDFEGAITWHENLAGDGSTWTAHPLAPSDGSYLGFIELAGELDAADLDGDGDLDVLAASQASLRWVENRADDASAWARWTLASTQLGRAIDAADFDGDGDLDVVGGDGKAAGILYFSNEAGGCRNGVDDDGDGLADYPVDPGCASASDGSEHAATLPCDDGADNDGDGRGDYRAAAGGDPGCRSPVYPLERTQCQDGLDNDGRPGIDFDGGASLDRDGDGRIDAAFNPATPLVGAADPQCTEAWRNREQGSACGLGFELAFLLPFLIRRYAIPSSLGRIPEPSAGGHAPL